MILFINAYLQDKAIKYLFYYLFYFPSYIYYDLDWREPQSRKYKLHFNNNNYNSYYCRGILG